MWAFVRFFNSKKKKGRNHTNARTKKSKKKSTLRDVQKGIIFFFRQTLCQDVKNINQYKLSSAECLAIFFCFSVAGFSDAILIQRAPLIVRRRLAWQTLQTSELKTRWRPSCLRAYQKNKVWGGVCLPRTKCKIICSFQVSTGDFQSSFLHCRLQKKKIFFFFGPFRLGGNHLFFPRRPDGANCDLSRDKWTNVWTVYFLHLGTDRWQASHLHGQIRGNVLHSPATTSSMARRIHLFEAPELVYKISAWNCFKRTSLRLLSRVYPQRSEKDDKASQALKLSSALWRFRSSPPSFQPPEKGTSQEKAREKKQKKQKQTHARQASVFTRRILDSLT